ncbi:MAG: HD domain-containing protein [Anaerolineae bacterium]
MSHTRADAWDTVCEFTESENLRRHMLAVEAVMRTYAGRMGGDEETWAIAGLLHDFDYERYPDEHPTRGEQILAERGWSEELRRAVLSHADHTGVERDSDMERALHASDDVTGFIVAVGLVRPDRDLGNVAMKSVRKKWKNLAFAGGVDRGEVEAAAGAIGMSIDDHLAVVLEAMQAIAADLGLAGSD